MLGRCVSYPRQLEPDEPLRRLRRLRMRVCGRCQQCGTDRDMSEVILGALEAGLARAPLAEKNDWGRALAAVSSSSREVSDVWTFIKATGGAPACVLEAVRTALSNLPQPVEPPAKRKRLEEHAAQREEPGKRPGQPGKRPGQPAPADDADREFDYVPRKGSGAYAILVAMHEDALRDAGPIQRAALVKRAQPYSNSSFQSSGHARSAWEGMKGLVSHGLVRREISAEPYAPHRFRLVGRGPRLAARLYALEKGLVAEGEPAAGASSSKVRPGPLDAFCSAARDPPVRASAASSSTASRASTASSSSSSAPEVVVLDSDDEKTVPRPAASVPPPAPAAEPHCAAELVLLVDSRERLRNGERISESLFAAVHRAVSRVRRCGGFALRVERRPLPLADFLLVARPPGGSAGGPEYLLGAAVERKTVPDLAARSLRGDHLRQLARLRAAGFPPGGAVLLVEGAPSAAARAPLLPGGRGPAVDTADAVLDLLSGLAVQGAVRPVCLPDIAASARFLCGLACQLAAAHDPAAAAAGERRAPAGARPAPALRSAPRSLWAYAEFAARHSFPSLPAAERSASLVLHSPAAQTPPGPPLVLQPESGFGRLPCAARILAALEIPGVVLEPEEGSEKPVGRWWAALAARPARGPPRRLVLVPAGPLLMALLGPGLDKDALLAELTGGLPPGGALLVLDGLRPSLARVEAAVTRGGPAAAAACVGGGTTAAAALRAREEAEGFEATAVGRHGAVCLHATGLADQGAPRVLARLAACLR